MPGVRPIFAAAEQTLGGEYTSATCCPSFIISMAILANNPICYCFNRRFLYISNRYRNIPVTIFTDILHVKLGSNVFLVYPFPGNNSTKSTPGPMLLDHIYSDLALALFYKIAFGT